MKSVIWRCSTEVYLRSLETFMIRTFTTKKVKITKKATLQIAL